MPLQLQFDKEPVSSTHTGTQYGNLTDVFRNKSALMFFSLGQRLDLSTCISELPLVVPRGARSYTRDQVVYRQPSPIIDRRELLKDSNAFLYSGNNPSRTSTLCYPKCGPFHVRPPDSVPSTRYPPDIIYLPLNPTAESKESEKLRASRKQSSVSGQEMVDWLRPALISPFREYHLSPPTLPSSWVHSL